MSETERTNIEAKIREIEIELTPGVDDDDIKFALVTEMLLVLMNTRGDAFESEVKQTVYVRSLDGIPAWAVKEALDKWYTGKLDIPRRELSYAPSPATLVLLSKVELRPFSDTRDSLQLLLDVKPLDETLREIMTTETAEPLVKPR